VTGASFCEVEGKIDLLKAMPALLKATLNTGFLTAYRHCRVLNAEKKRDYYNIETSLGFIRCRRLVNAAGAGAMSIASLFGVQLKVEERPIQMLATEAVEPFMHHLLYHAKERMSLKQVSNGNVLVGGGWLGSVDERTGLTLVKRESIQGSLQVAASIVPSIQSLNLLRCWGGIIFTPPGGLPIVDSVPGHEGLFFAVSNHFGVTLGPFIGRTIAEIIRAKPPSIDIKPLSLNRPAVPEAAYSA
jgi:glycine/D-amino acid oxidase-like deaminating enzyme